MYRFRTVFDENLKTLSLKHLDLSTNQIDDDGGCFLIQGIYYQDCLETLNLKNNLVKDMTAQAIATYVSKRGIRLKKVELSMNRGFP
jgi:Ran GTPase-activating protein (RanGAP) involved in mRNA processing and transport